MSNNVSLIVQTRTIQRNISNVQFDMIRRGNEVTTGKKQDLVSELGGEIRNFIDLRSIRSSLKNREERLVTGDNRLAQMGVGLQQISKILEPFKNFQAQVPLVDRKNIDTYIDLAKNALDGVQNSLNIQWGGRYLFAGDDVLERPIDNIDTLTTTVKNVITTYAGTLPTGKISEQSEIDAIIAEIDTIFNDTHATSTFSGLVYNGSTNHMAGIEIAEGEIMEYGVRADSSQLRNAIKGMVMIAASDTLRPLMDGSNSRETTKLEKSFLSKATAYTGQGTTELIEMQASLGFKQERIKYTQEGLDKIIFEYETRIGLYENADQYEAGVAYSELQRQLEASFYVTAKITEQSLLNYVR